MDRIPDARSESFDPEDMNAVIRRLAGAGWIEKNTVSVVDVKGLLIQYSENGRQRMAAFSNFLKTFPAEFFNSPVAAANPDNQLKLIAGVGMFAPEMVFPPLSERGFNALIALALAFDSANPDIPSNRL